jgi:cytochrome c-type biogenesis protein CcmH/NrfG
MDRGELDQAIDHLQKTVAIEPNLAEAWSDLGDAFLLKGKAREATGDYERALDLAPELVKSLSGLGWILATCPDGSLRNGARAVQLSTKAVELSRRQRPIALRTLAAAYAEVGEFDDAVAAAWEALELALTKSNSDLASKLRLEIDLYQTRLPLRDAALTR